MPRAFTLSAFYHLSPFLFIMVTVHATSPAHTKLLVSTQKTQGQRRGDFCWTNEGELLHFAIECDCERVDGPCGCRRSLVGLDSMKATTTFMIQEIEISEQEFVKKIEASYAAAGFGDVLTSEDAREEAARLIDLASAFPTGCIVERRGNKLQSRA